MKIEKLLENFWFKVFRNGFILAMLNFMTLWTVLDINWSMVVKPSIIFLFVYSFTELARHYGLATGKKGATYVYS